MTDYRVVGIDSDAHHFHDEYAAPPVFYREGDAPSASDVNGANMNPACFPIEHGRLGPLARVSGTIRTMVFPIMVNEKGGFYNGEQIFST